MNPDDAITNLKEAYLLGAYDAEWVIRELRTDHGLSAAQTMHLMRAWDDERRRRKAWQRLGGKGSCT